VNVTLILVYSPYNSETPTYKTVPGPGTYEPKPAINEKGNYYVSKYHSSGATTIDPPA
jgi:hypothetical protein